MRHSSRLFVTLLHTFCVLALSLSCGTPEALHDLGHKIAHTACESSLPAAPNSVAPEADTCWIQSLVTSVSHHAASAPRLPQVPTLTPSPTTDLLNVANFVPALNYASWHTSRGPPAV